MRKLTIGTQRYTKVTVADEPSHGGACHAYAIGEAGENKRESAFGYIHFQKGPIKEHGVNGCHHEDLIAIVIDRLQHFQKGEFRCRENAIAITKLEEALHWLDHRTTDRINQSVEGTSEHRKKVP